MVFSSWLEWKIDNKAELIALYLEVNVNVNQMVMKIKMFTYPGEVISTCEFMWSDRESLYDLNCSVQGESTNETSAIQVLSAELH